MLLFHSTALLFFLNTLPLPLLLSSYLALYLGYGNRQNRVESFLSFPSGSNPWITRSSPFSAAAVTCPRKEHTASSNPEISVPIRLPLLCPAPSCLCSFLVIWFGAYFWEGTACVCFEGSPVNYCVV